MQTLMDRLRHFASALRVFAPLVLLIVLRASAASAQAAPAESFQDYLARLWPKAQAARLAPAIRMAARRGAIRRRR